MKKSIVIFVALCGVIACAVVFLNRQAPSPAAAGPAIEPAPPVRSFTEANPADVPRTEMPPVVSDQTAVSSAKPVPVDVKPDGTVTELSRTVDELLPGKTRFGDRYAMWQKVKSAGELDQVVAELKRRAAANPNDPAIPTALGEALMNKFPLADPDESAMNGMLMDQSFNRALKLDPANWEAQFFKASELTYWPAEFNKGPEAIQRFSALIDQQETMPAQPEFAQTYALLGDYYQKTGLADKAAATWQLGLTKFPGDPTLLKKISGQ